MTTDHLGSPRVITDQNGDVTNRKDYTAFGEVNYTAHRAAGLGYAVNAEETRKGYTGYEKDDESGLDFAQARYYNSVHGRYTSIDPLTASMNVRNPQTLNRYSYVLNSPYKYTDPLGLLPAGNRDETGTCGAEHSSCVDDWGSNWNDPAPEPEQEETEEGVAENQETEGGAQQTASPSIVYVFVTLTREDMTPSLGNETPNFGELVAIGAANGIDVRIISSTDGEGASEANTKNGMFLQALQDPNALGVIYVGHGSNGDISTGSYRATAINLNSTGGLMDNSKIAKTEGVKAQFIGIFGCGTVNTGASIPGKGKVVAMDGGKDGETSLHGIGWAAFAATKALVEKKNISAIIDNSNTALKRVEALKLVKTGTTKVIDEGDRVVRVR